MNDPSFHQIDHTADVGVEVTAPTLEDLFGEAGRALTDLICDLERVEPARRYPIEAARDEGEESVAELLAEWLRRILEVFNLEGAVLSRFEGVQVDAEAGTARAVGLGEPLRLDDHGFRTEIKAVTYHELAVERRDDGWWARVIFDV